MRKDRSGKECLRRLCIHCFWYICDCQWFGLACILYHITGIKQIIHVHTWLSPPLMQVYVDFSDLSVFNFKLVDCLEKCLIYGHIRRFANWFYYSFTTFNGLSLDMQKAPAGCRIDRYTTLRGTSKRKNKITPPIRRRFSLLHWRTGTLLFYALMLRSKGKWSLDLCGS